MMPALFGVEAKVTFENVVWYLMVAGQFLIMNVDRCLPSLTSLIRIYVPSFVGTSLTMISDPMDDLETETMVNVLSALSTTGYLITRMPLPLA